MNYELTLLFSFRKSSIIPSYINIGILVLCKEFVLFLFRYVISDVPFSFFYYPVLRLSLRGLTEWDIWNTLVIRCESLQTLSNTLKYRSFNLKKFKLYYFLINFTIDFYFRNSFIPDILIPDKKREDCKVILLTFLKFFNTQNVPPYFFHLTLLSYGLFIFLCKTLDLTSI